MSMLTLGTVLEALTGRPFEHVTQVITDASIDSRLVIPGSMFVAIKGERVDGHEYVHDATQQGAVVILIEREISVPMTTIDITTSIEEVDFSEINIPLAIPAWPAQLPVRQWAWFARNDHQPTRFGL